MRPHTVGEPGIVRIFDGEPALQAGNPYRSNCEGLGRAPQLARLRLVLGVEDDNERTAREIERHIQGARLGTGLPARRNDDLIVRRQPHLHQRHVRLPIIRLDDEFDVEFGARIIRYYGATATKGRLMR